jgi:hypothetical protein
MNRRSREYLCVNLLTESISHNKTLDVEGQTSGDPKVWLFKTGSHAELLRMRIQGRKDAKRSPSPRGREV